jgi:hypothetical protein
MEFVIVTCDSEERAVFIDNQEQGVTDRRLSVPEGLHVFDLGAPQNYAPPFQEVLIENTIASEPLVVPFTLIAREAAPRKRTKRKTTRKRRNATRPSRAPKSRKKTSTKKRSTKTKAMKKASRKKR